MIFKSVALSCVLLQGMVAVASENSKICLNKSNGSLRQSQGALSKSQEISASREKTVMASLYYVSPCSRRLSIDTKREMMPIPPSYYFSDCP